MKKQTAKLALRKDTIRTLKTIEMTDVAGGKPNQSKQICVDTDLCTIGSDTGHL